jgi:hypothetical protein
MRHGLDDAGGQHSNDVGQDKVTLAREACRFAIDPGLCTWQD